MAPTSTFCSSLWTEEWRRRKANRCNEEAIIRKVTRDGGGNLLHFIPEESQKRIRRIPQEVREGGEEEKKKNLWSNTRLPKWLTSRTSTFCLPSHKCSNQATVPGRDRYRGDEPPEGRGLSPLLIVTRVTLVTLTVFAPCASSVNRPGLYRSSLPRALRWAVFSCWPFPQLDRTTRGDPQS